jgi:transposase
MALSSEATSPAWVPRAPAIRLVAINSRGQQEVMALHRERSMLIRERTALMNKGRGLLAESG